MLGCCKPAPRAGMPIHETKPLTKTMKIREVVEYLNSRTLPYYQESYDNAGLLVGDETLDITGVLITLDVTPAVVQEAIDEGLNLIVSHHPLIFGGIKRITPHNETGRMVMQLVENKIAVYAAHTNLDNLQEGVNGILAEKLGLTGCTILRPVMGQLRKLVTYVPLSHADSVRQALFAAGAGCIGDYDSCSYNSEGIGTFRAGEGCHPYCGTVGEVHREEECRIEVVYEKRIEQQLLRRLRAAHPYEEPAIDCIALENSYARVGAGMVGQLPEPCTAADFLATVKERLGLPVVRCSVPSETLKERAVCKVALCGGSGSFLINDAKRSGADLYLTADLKYHDFQAAEQELILADIGHYESEQFAKELFYRMISQKFSTFACQISRHQTGYVYYI